LPLKAFCPDGFKNLKRWQLSPADEVVRFAEKEKKATSPKGLVFLLQIFYY
jgi:hypothetical protein